MSREQNEREQNERYQAAVEAGDVAEMARIDGERRNARESRRLIADVAEAELVLAADGLIAELRFALDRLTVLRQCAVVRAPAAGDVFGTLDSTAQTLRTVWPTAVHDAEAVMAKHRAGQSLFGGGR